MIKLRWLYLINFCLFGTTLLISTLAEASVNAPSSSHIHSGKELCASALNSYLLYRQNDRGLDKIKLQDMEDRIESLCEGYQVRLVDNNGTLSGIIEAMD